MRYVDQVMENKDGGGIAHAAPREPAPEPLEVSLPASKSRRAGQCTTHPHEWPYPATRESLHACPLDGPIRNLYIIYIQRGHLLKCTVDKPRLCQPYLPLL